MRSTRAGRLRRVIRGTLLAKRVPGGTTEMLRVAIGPFDCSRRTETWPLWGSDVLAREGFEVVPFPAFEAGGLTHHVDVLVVWSPEYLEDRIAAIYRDWCHYAVAFLGDWHIRVPDLDGYDLIATDSRGVQMLRERGISEDRLLWWRGFSFDPDLHAPPTPDAVRFPRIVDVAFMGRGDGGPRDALLERVERWCQGNGRTFLRNHDAYPRGDEARSYRQAKVVVNWAQRGELNMRAYEAAACGALSVLQHDAIEVVKSGAPIPTYEPNHVEDFLEAWLANDAAREAVVQQQAAWVQHEKPVDHLRFLLRAIRERMKGGDAHAKHVATPERKEVMPSEITGGSGGQEKEEAVPPENEQRPEVLALVPPEARTILDLGCGAGGVGWALKRSRLGVHVTGVDVDERYAPQARARLDAFFPTDLNNASAIPQEPWAIPGRYDCVLWLDNAEHLIDPWSVAAKVKPLLAPGGVLIASIPQFRNVANLFEVVVAGEWRYHVHGKDEWRGPHDNVNAWGHLRYFTRQSIARLFEDAGYSIERWEASHLRAPGLEGFTQRLASLVRDFGGDEYAFWEGVNVVQWIVVCVVKSLAPQSAAG